MTDTRIYEVNAIILHSREYGEGHRMITLFTREMGKVLAVAKGVRKPKAKLAAALQHFVCGEAHLAKGRRFDVITQMRVLNPYYGLRRSVTAFAYASYFAELFAESLEERQPYPALFDLLTDAMTWLAEGQTPEMLARYVEINLIGMLGYLPHLTHCAHCRRPLATYDAEGKSVWPTWLGFSAGQGGAICPACLPNVQGARRIAAGTVQIAQVLLTKGLAALDDLQLSSRLCREVEETFREYLEYRLEHRLESTRFLKDWGERESSLQEQIVPGRS